MRSEGQKQSRRHEDRLAKAVGGSRNAASGAFWSRKGDVRNQDMLIEHKWTGKSQFTVKASHLEKIVKEAILDGRTPVFGFHLNGENYIVMEENDFLEMRHYLQECTCLTSHQNHGNPKQNATDTTPTSGSHPETNPNIL